jgi:hypothetical protein
MTSNDFLLMPRKSTGRLRKDWALPKERRKDFTYAVSHVCEWSRPKKSAVERIDPVVAHEKGLARSNLNWIKVRCCYGVGEIRFCQRNTIDGNLTTFCRNERWTEHHDPANNLHKFWFGRVAGNQYFCDDELPRFHCRRLYRCSPNFLAGAYGRGHRVGWNPPESLAEQRGMGAKAGIRRPDYEKSGGRKQHQPRSAVPVRLCVLGEPLVLGKQRRRFHDVVELRGFEPLTSCMPCKRSTN